GQSGTPIGVRGGRNRGEPHETGPGGAGFGVAGLHGMDIHLRRTVGALELLALALTALLLARATAGLVESVIRRGTPALAVGVTAGGSTARGSRSFHGKSADGILGRNVFCSTCPPIDVAAHDEGKA